MTFWCVLNLKKEFIVCFNNLFVYICPHGITLYPKKMTTELTNISAICDLNFNNLDLLYCVEILERERERERERE